MVLKYHILINIWRYCKSSQVSLPQLLDQMDTELRLLREELRQHKMQQKGSVNNGHEPQTPAPEYTDLDLTNGGFQHWREIFTAINLKYNISVDFVSETSIGIFMKKFVGELIEQTC